MIGYFGICGWLKRNQTSLLGDVHRYVCQIGCDVDALELRILIATLPCGQPVSSAWCDMSASGAGRTVSPADLTSASEISAGTMRIQVRPDFSFSARWRMKLGSSAAVKDQPASQQPTPVPMRGSQYVRESPPRTLGMLAKRRFCVNCRTPPKLALGVRHFMPKRKFRTGCKSGAESQKARQLADKLTSMPQVGG